MYEVTVNTHFSAAHRLKDYAGSCARVHGHNWEVEISLRGEQLDEQGILLDFRELKRRVKSVLERIDHADLNTVEPFDKLNPTSENIARYLFDWVSEEMDCESYEVSRVLVRETPGSSASYSR